MEALPHAADALRPKETMEISLPIIFNHFKKARNPPFLPTTHTGLLETSY
jgi:hypothetical protein